MMATMTEEPIPADPLHAIAKQSAAQVNRIVIAMLADAVEQIQKSPDTWQHEEVTLDMSDLADEALAVPYISPRDVVFASARASAALIVQLTKPLGIDPVELVKGYEEQFFRRTL